MVKTIKKITKSQQALNIWAAILIVWSIYRYNFRLPEWFDELIAKPLIFFLPIFYYIVKIERKNFFEETLINKKKLIPDFLLGILVLVLFFISAFLGNFYKNKTIDFLFLKNTQQIVLLFITSLATGFTEEVLSRGFVLKRLYDESKNMISASFIASVLFFFLHVPALFTNAKMLGNTLLLVMFTNLGLSLAISFIYLTRRSLILPIIIHAFTFYLKII